MTIRRRHKTHEESAKKISKISEISEINMRRKKDFYFIALKKITIRTKNFHISSTPERRKAKKHRGAQFRR